MRVANALLCSIIPRPICDISAEFAPTQSTTCTLQMQAYVLLAMQLYLFTSSPTNFSSPGAMACGLPSNASPVALSNSPGLPILRDCHQRSTGGCNASASNPGRGQRSLSMDHRMETLAACIARRRAITNCSDSLRNAPSRRAPLLSWAQTGRPDTLRRQGSDKMNYLHTLVC